MRIRITLETCYIHICSIYCQRNVRIISTGTIEIDSGTADGVFSINLKERLVFSCIPWVID